MVDGDGVRGRDAAALPAPFAELVRRHAAVTELTLDAALTGDRTTAGAAFLLDPLAGRGDLERHRGDGRRAPGGHGGLVAAVRPVTTA